MTWAGRVLSAVATSAALVFTSMSGPAAAASLPSESFADLVAEATPAVVSISTHRVPAISADEPAGESGDQQKKKDSQYSLRSAPASLLIHPAMSLPIATSSQMPTRSKSHSVTARASRPS